MEKSQLTEAMKAEFIRRMWDVRTVEGTSWGRLGDGHNELVREGVLAGVVKDFEFLTEFSP